MKKIFAEMIKDFWPSIMPVLIAFGIVAVIAWFVVDSAGGTGEIQKWLHKPMSEVKILDVVWLVIIFSVLTRK